MKFHKIRLQGKLKSCVARAIRHSTGLRFDRVYADLWVLTKWWHRKGVMKKSADPDHGLPRAAVDPYLIACGYEWHPCIIPGSSKRTRINNLPKKGNLIAVGYRHMVAVKDGVVYDLTPWAIERNICIIGYYKRS